MSNKQEQCVWCQHPMVYVPLLGGSVTTRCLNCCPITHAEVEYVEALRKALEKSE